MQSSKQLFNRPTKAHIIDLHIIASWETSKSFTRLKILWSKKILLTWFREGKWFTPVQRAAGCRMRTQRRKQWPPPLPHPVNDCAEGEIGLGAAVSTSRTFVTAAVLVTNVWTIPWPSAMPAQILETLVMACSGPWRACARHPRQRARGGASLVWE